MRSRPIVLASKFAFIGLTVIEFVAIAVLGILRLFQTEELELIPPLVILAAAACFVVFFAVDGVRYRAN